MAELKIEGRLVSYFECGSGVPVVLLHAGAGSGKQWLKTARLLEARFQVIAPDLWGFGGTEKWSGEHELTHDDQALLVVGVIEHLCKEPSTLSDTPTEVRRPYGSYSRKESSCGPRFSSSRS